MAWQKRARAGVALFVVGFAVVVYLSIGQRQQAAPPTRVERQDPTASTEIDTGVLRKLLGIEEDYKISYESMRGYTDGSSKLTGIRIQVPKRNGRDFVITAKEAETGRDERVLELAGDVKLEASDGFSLQTAAATFNRDDGIARAPGPVAFAKGAMTGSGVGMAYDEPRDVLTITDDSKVTMTGEDGMVTMSFDAGPSTLDRLKNTLQLDGGVHVVRSAEEFDADRATALLTEEEEHVTFIQLRGNARVAGGSSVDSMSAQDIDLDYTDDGETLERIVMTGDAAAAIPSASGQAAREIFGGTLDLTLAPDGAVTRAVGANGVRLTLPAADGGPARNITARSLDGQGEAGRGLTSTQFTDDVDYREVDGTATSRRARSRSLRVSLDGDAIADATFKGQVTFEDGTLEARAAEAGYLPSKGAVHLTGSESGRPPHVEDEQITIDATTIDVAFETRRMTASGAVRTTLRSAPAEGSGASRRPASKLPGLLKADQAVTIAAATLDYGGSGGKVTYTGTATLRQGEGTFIKASRIVIDQEAGDLSAEGDARAELVDDDGTTQGTADTIRYTDAKRTIAYSSVTTLANVKGPQGDLRARTIDVVLEPKGSRLARLEATTLVSLVLGSRTITGTKLQYDASKTKDEYVMLGTTARPMTIVDRAAAGCQQSFGMKLIFSKSTDSITIEGEDLVRSKMGGGGACGTPTLPSSPPTPAR